MHQLDQWIEGIIDNALKPENFSATLTQSLPQSIPELPYDLIQIFSISADLMLSKQTNTKTQKLYKYPDLIEKVDAKADQLLANSIEGLFRYYKKCTRNSVPKKSIFPKYMECIETPPPYTNRGKVTSKMIFKLKDSQTEFVHPFNAVKLSDLRKIAVLAPGIAKMKLPTKMHELYPLYFQPTCLHSIDNLIDQISLFLKQLKTSYFKWRNSAYALETAERKSVIFNTAILLAEDIKQVKAQQTTHLDEITKNFKYRLQTRKTDALEFKPAISPVTLQIDDLTRYFEDEIQNFYSHNSLQYTSYSMLTS